MQVGGDARNATAAADRHDDRVERGVQLRENLRCDGSLPRSGAHVVERGNHGCAGFGYVLGGRSSGGVIGLTDHEQFDKRSAVGANAITLLRGGIGRNVDPTLDLHRSARESNTLRMVTGTGSHYAGTAFGLVELSDQVVRSTNLVRTNALEVLALEVHVCPGQRRKTVAVLQRCRRNDVLNSLDGRVDLLRVERGDGGLRYYDIGRVRHPAIFARRRSTFPPPRPAWSARQGGGRSAARIQL